MPQYFKEGERNITIYVNFTKDQWVLGNESHVDFIFNLSSSTDKESPLDWLGWHKVTSQAEMPTLRLDDPTVFPPIILPIIQFEEHDTLYEGNYELDIFDLHSYMPQYKRALEEGLLRLY